MDLFTVAGAANTTAISVAKDMTEGIIARAKTMRIFGRTGDKKRQRR
jgi:hypothetical protein